MKNPRATSGLKIAPYHRSEKDARAYTAEIADALGINNFKSKLLAGREVTFFCINKTIKFDPRAEVRNSRKTGVPSVIQSIYDQSDKLMPIPLDIGAWTSQPGLIKLSIKIGIYSVEVDSPGVLEPPIGVLSSDILYYREKAVQAAGNMDIKDLARAYRTYLQVCISLIDAFLGHAAFALKQTASKTTTSPHFEILTSTAPQDKRIEAWHQLFGYDFADFCKTKMWSDLIKIKKERNRYVHPSEPIYAISLSEISDTLNRCRDGIGGTLEHLRKTANLDTKMSYVQKIKTAPIIENTK